MLLRRPLAAVSRNFPMDKYMPSSIRKLLVAFGALSTLGLGISNSSAVVTATLVAGTTCTGASAAIYTPGVGTQDVTVCVTTTTEFVCGSTLQFAAANAGEANRFNLTARAVAPAFPDIAAGFTNPTPITAVSSGDLGSNIVTGGNAVSPGANIALGTFTIAPQATATNNSYVISLGTGAVVATATSATGCGLANVPPIAASFTFNKFIAPTPTAPTASLAAGPTLSAAGLGTQTVNILTQGSLTGSLGLACTIPAGASAFAVTSNANQTINATPAPGATGAAIGLSCTPQVAQTTATLSCTQTASPAGAALPNLTSTITCPAAPPPAAPTVSALAATTLTGGAGTVPVTVATSGAATASLALGCTIPATGASNFLVTTGGTRTLTAPATVGLNAPAVGLSCVPQLSGAVTATLTCTQTATPGGVLAPLTAAITCPVAPTAVISAVIAPGAVTLPAYSVGVPSSSTALRFNVTGAAGSLSCVPTGAGYSATPNPLNLVVGTEGIVTVVYTGSTPGTFPGTLVCTSTLPAGGGPFTYNLSTTVAAAPPANNAVPTMGAAGLGLMSLMLIGLAAFQRRRRQL